MTINDFRKQFFALVEQSARIVITSHTSPDDDSIGSVLSLYALLAKKYPQKQIRMMYSGATLNRWKVFSMFEKIEWVDDIANHIDHDDLVIILDASRNYLCTTFPEKLSLVKMRIAIDHHRSTADTFSLLLQDVHCTSNCELLFHVFFEGETIDRAVAEYLLAGITGDTGVLRYVPPEQSHVFTIVKELVEIVGMRIDEFRSRFTSIPMKILPLLQELSKNITFAAVEGWPPLQYSYLDRSVVSQGNYSDDDISAASHLHISHYLPKVEGYTWGFVITPRTDNTCRISGRSLPESVNVRDMHERLGIGGGHDQASGGSFQEADPNACIERVLEWMKNNTPLLG
ncbi:MAG TPA: DHH family phosphoesterase [Candidatus Paceibacterota bacterium]|nr:DHH family phosphoesterase [Candidatus Paceibacterota bacterium]